MAGVIPADWPHSSFSTHVHMLTDVMLSFRPRRILETGSGLYSTPFFLAFDIDELVSLENNPEWLKETGDSRHTMVEVNGNVADNLPDLSKFDLIFVDDDPVDRRVDTLFAVLESARCPVAVHDTNDMRLHAVICDMPNHTDVHHPPTTTVVCPAATKEFMSWLHTR